MHLIPAVPALFLSSLGGLKKLYISHAVCVGFWGFSCQSSSDSHYYGVFALKPGDKCTLFVHLSSLIKMLNISLTTIVAANV